MPKKITETEMLDCLARHAQDGMLQVQGERFLMSIGWFKKRPKRGLRRALRHLVRNERRVKKRDERSKSKARRAAS